MMRIFSEIVVTLSASPALWLLVKGTLVVALALTSAWLARRSRAAVRHALLASGFSVLLALPIVSIFARPIPISVPVAAADEIVPRLSDAIPLSLCVALQPRTVVISTPETIRQTCPLLRSRRVNMNGI